MTYSLFRPLRQTAGIVSEGNDLWIFEEMGIKTNVQQYTTFAAGDGECDPKQPAFHVTKEVWKEKRRKRGR